MNPRTRTFAASAASLVLLAVLAALLFDGTFNAVRSMPIRVCVSVVTAIFIVLCALTVASFFLSGYFFLQMVNSPQPGQSVFDARMLKGKSLLSDRYLTEEGKIARSRLFRSLRWFGACWFGGVCIGFLARWLATFG